MEVKLSVLDKFNERKQLQLVEAHVGKETLGVMIALDGNIEDYKIVLQKKVSKWKDVILVRKLPSSKTFAAFKTILMKTLEYSMLTTTFKERET